MQAGAVGDLTGLSRRLKSQFGLPTASITLDPVGILLRYELLGYACFSRD